MSDDLRKCANGHAMIFHGPPINDYACGVCSPEENLRNAMQAYSESVDGGARPDHNWRDLYDKIPPERRAKIEVQVMHDLEKMDIVDRCEYLSVAWRCVRAKGHKEGHSPFLEDGEWMAQRPQCF